MNTLRRTAARPPPLEDGLSVLEQTVQRASADEALEALCALAAQRSGLRVGVAQWRCGQPRRLAGELPPGPTTRFALPRRAAAREALVVGAVLPAEMPYWVQVARLAATILWRRDAERALRLARGRSVRPRSGRNTVRPMDRLRHDLKTPLTVARGYLDMLRRGMAGPLTPAMVRYVERVTSALLHQQQILDGSRAQRSS